MRLYHRWQQIADESGNSLALYESADDRRWSFNDLAVAVEAHPQPSDSVVFPKGSGADFVIELLAAWRAGRPACPIEEQPPELPDARLPDGCSHLKTTSATTGPSRLIAFTEEQLIADCQNIMTTMGLRREWPNLGIISLAHSYGFSNLVLPLLLDGIPLILPGSALPECISDAAAQFESLTLPAVPALWEAWHKATAIPGNIRLAISAGAPLSTNLENEVYRQFGLKIHNFYGSSECGGIAFDPSSEPRQDDRYVGRPLANVKLEIDEAGCLIIDSDAVAQSYWPEPSPRLGNGRFVTEDLAEWSQEGIRLIGRAGDVINVAGRKVVPESIEAALSKHPAVYDCLVFGIPSRIAGRGDDIVACIVPASLTSSQEIRRHLGSVLPGWQIPRHCELVSEIGHNARGKRSRAAWRNWYLNKPISG